MNGLRHGVVLTVLLLSGACATSGPPAAPLPPTTIDAVGLVSESYPLPRGYLDPEDLPDGIALLPPPPAAGSAAQAADQEAFRQAMAAPADRQALATSDADLEWRHLIRPFEEILGTSLSDGSKPHAEMLLRRAMADGGVSTLGVKNHYSRVRPFVANDVGSCTPQDEESLQGNGSYPSGHAAIGWMLALVLTDLVPERQNELLRRGYEFGESRVVCRVHWLSDTTAGRVMASATFARLQSDPTFEAQVALARAEMAESN